MLARKATALRRAGVAVWLFALACGPAIDPQQYRLGGGGEGWSVVGRDRVAEDLEPRYPELFAGARSASRVGDLDLLEVRDDLERVPSDRRNYDALNSLAIAYFELNLLAEEQRGAGLDYLGRSFQCAKVLAVPWRAYSLTDDPALRDAILDFFEDAGSGEKRATAATAPRVSEIVASLERKEPDPVRRARILAIAAGIEARFEAVHAPELAPDSVN